jgi:hypothetical protein
MTDTPKPKRRDGIKPLCPVHHEEMVGPIDSVLELCSCARPGCETCWRAASEYFRFVGGVPTKTILQMQQRVPCQKPGHGHMFLARVTRDKAIWECSVDGCAENRERLLDPPSIWSV